MLISSAVDTVEELLEQYKPYLSPKPSKQEKKKKKRGKMRGDFAFLVQFVLIREFSPNTHSLKEEKSPDADNRGYTGKFHELRVR